MKKVCFIAGLILTLFIFLIVNEKPSFGHRINVFCWVVGEKARCEASFTPGGPVKGGEVQVWIKETNSLLVKGKTDEKGVFEFGLPKEVRSKKWNLKVICKAPMGHQNFWIITPEDYLEGEEVEEGKTEHTQEEVSGQSTIKTTGIDDNKVIKKILSEVITKELDPIKKELIMLNQQKITLHDIISGIGYILGFMGIVFYFKARGRKS